MPIRTSTKRLECHGLSTCILTPHRIDCLTADSQQKHRLLNTHGHKQPRNPPPFLPDRHALSGASRNHHITRCCRETGSTSFSTAFGVRSRKVQFCVALEPSVLACACFYGLHTEWLCIRASEEHHKSSCTCMLLWLHNRMLLFPSILCRSLLPPCALVRWR